MTSKRAVAPILKFPDELTPHYRVGSGTPVVLLHGATMTWRAWCPVLPFLAGRHDVFVPTLAEHRGGPRLRPDQPLELSSLVDVLCAQLDEAGIEDAHLVGNSLGGMLAFEVARRRGARSVLALSPGGAWRAHRDLLRLIWLFRLGHTAAANPRLSALARNRVLRRMVLGRVVARPERVSDEVFEDLVANMLDCRLLEAMLTGRASLRPMGEFDVALCPVHIAWAQRDRIIPFRRYGAPLRELVRGAEFSVLPGVGHLPMYDDPRLVARTIVTWTSAVDEIHAEQPLSLGGARPRRRAS